MDAQPRACSERMLIFLVGAAQFVLIVDFMMVMPLGPDFARALNIPMSHLGWIGGAYTLAAALSGILSSTMLDRFDRRTALLVALSGVGFFTFLSGLAWNFESLVVSRFITGIFGGPCTALSYAIIADWFPPQKRGQAMGKVMGAFSAASVLGVPFGLEMARLGDWRMPFFVCATSAVLVLVMVYYKLPSFREHIGQEVRVKSFVMLKGLLTNWIHIGVFTLVGIGTFASFLIIPNLASYAQFNMGLPREYLGLMYVVAGVASFVVLRVAGKMADKRGAAIVSLIGSMVLIVDFYFGFISPEVHLPVLAIYVLFMIGMSMRNVSNSTLAAKVPKPAQRAGFLALNSCVSQLFAALGAFTASLILVEGESHALIGMDHVAMISAALIVLIGPIMFWVEHHITRRDAAKVMVATLEQLP